MSNDLDPFGLFGLPFLEHFSSSDVVAGALAIFLESEGRGGELGKWACAICNLKIFWGSYSLTLSGIIHVYHAVPKSQLATRGMLKV